MSVTPKDGSCVSVDVSEYIDVNDFVSVCVVEMDRTSVSVNDGESLSVIVSESLAVLVSEYD